ncbi:ArsR family transcriptional regulator [Thalassovita aquimarina]|uniref:ArsR family transcriptional regulator n=1 Tax=Thalassovita aquimarina TaxID=2785917 RepID=A0ABS5HSJ9_9RHOB|nr:ArsR family transcriptional regulator [Thalassovita aquimarina]MBR9651821.1 ArsR family transcriptional regulator [Thalassovita aquimarina]
MDKDEPRTIYDGDTPESVRAALRQDVQEQIIECLNRFYSLEKDMWGKPVEALIVRTVVQGRLQDRLYDLSALSDVLDLPIGTLHRKVADLVEAGYLKREKRGKSVYLAPTEDTCGALDQSFEDMVGALRRLYERGRL